MVSSMRLVSAVASIAAAYRRAARIILGTPVCGRQTQYNPPITDPKPNAAISRLYVAAPPCSAPRANSGRLTSYS